MPGIVSVQPAENYLMEIKFDNGNTVILDMKTKIQTARFWQLRDKKLFEAATTDGTSIRWNEFTEIYMGEIFDIAQSNRKKTQNETCG
ncbi:DUF2442 domain-containing protein [Faecalispora anaeroviscerum]|uniref:DUF2442 domain-containing protein n=1 Tax=Faecalispora anaeroviscerum TaxID=2991836 RepID=UPI0024BBCD5B|nr:DUF2442 domain-containing protein [Faecalispora anaeroviscerum]